MARATPLAAPNLGRREDQSWTMRTRTPDIGGLHSPQSPGARFRRPERMSWTDQLRFDREGLIPVVAQDAESGEVLMLAYATREALQHTLETGRAHYWSRSRGALWSKGETSGNVQQVEEVRVDCDGDTVLYRVRQTGPACHTGTRSCFARAVTADGTLRQADDPRPVLARLADTIAQRDRDRPAGSYVTRLLEGGVDRIAKKVGEEATEVVIAVKNADAAEIRWEAADLLFHLLVLLRASGTPVSDVEAELARRFAPSTAHDADPAGLG